MRAEEKSIQQGYVDWVYLLVAAKVEKVKSMENPGSLGFSTMKKQRLEELRVAQDDGSLVIGCLDMVNGEAWYIGKAHVDGDGRQEVALMDWRAPFAETFFQADRSEPRGIGRRLTFTMRQRNVDALAEDVLTRGFKLPETEIEVSPLPPDAPSRPRLPRVRRKPARLPDPEAGSPNDEAPDEGLDIRARDLLLDELDRDHTGHMHEIVSTIQADQDRLIRRATERITVVQGGPGTGKTVVGLHRAAWVLYQQRHRQLSDQSVLIVGPNRAFVDYIGAVLPKLGETATHLWLAEFALLDLPENERARLANTRASEERAERIKGDVRMLNFVEEAVWGHATPASLSVPFGRFSLSLTGAQVTKMVAKLRKSGVAYDRARQRLTTEVIRGLFAVAEERVTRGGGRNVGSFEDFAASVEPILHRMKWIDNILPAIVPRLVIQHALSDADFFDRIAKRHLTPTQRSVLRPPAKARRMVWSEADLPLVAEAAFLITGTSRRFGHLVVDEAQDLSPMQWRLVARRSSSHSMTILGDLAQATSVWAPDSWMDALTSAGLGESVTVAELALGYRVPKEIMELASRLLPEIAPTVSVPQSVRSGAAPLAYKVRSARAVPLAVAGLIADSATGSVGVIAADAQVESVLAAAREKGIEAGRGSSDGLSHRITVLDPGTSKGLEFDHVIVVEPSAIGGRSAREKRRLFVALTRATKTLTIVHANLLPAALRGAVEDRDLEIELPAPASRAQRSTSKTLPRKSAPSEVAPRVAPPGPSADGPLQVSGGAFPPESNLETPSSSVPAELNQERAVKHGPAGASAPAEPAQRPRQVTRQLRTKLLRKVTVRARPSASSPELARVRGGLGLLETWDGWARVRTEQGIEGWVATGDLKF